MDKQEIINLYENGMNVKQISRFLGIAYKPALKFLKRKGIRIRGVSEAQRDLLINHGFFSVTNAQTSYWAGLWAADGCLHMQMGRSFRLCLSLKDGEHVEKFASQIGAAHKVKRNVEIETCFGKTTASIVSFCSKEMWMDLNSNFQLCENKSKILEPPLNLPVGCYKHFIRGYLDGDGHILLEYDGIGFSGTKVMLMWIRSILQEHCKAGSPSIFPDKTIYGLRFNGRRQVDSIVNWLYDESTEDIRMNRKFLIARRFLGGVL